MPGLNRYDYKGSFWPDKIESVYDAEILDWMEQHLRLISLTPRVHGYNVLSKTFVNQTNVEALSRAAASCWEAIMMKNLAKFGEAVRESFEAQIKIFPNMVDAEIMRDIRSYHDKALGWKLSGAGGGGYIILVSEKPPENTFKIRIRRT